LKQYFIQYHNADNLDYFPDTESDNVDTVTFDTTVRDDFSFFTRKQFVEKTIGDYCFLIVGTGKKNKKYYTWSFFMIDKVEKDNGFFNAYGTGFNFERPVLLNDLPDFAGFRNFCGNFGIGFQNITKHDFCKTLVAFSDNVNLLPDPLRQAENNQLLMTALEALNKQMQNVKPEKQLTEVELILRNDRRIVTLIKKAANYKCQFPHCNSEIKTKAGLNYVEVAHVKPVYNAGQSILGNLIVLCPNHHKEFDYGDLLITQQTLDRLNGSLNGKDFQIELIKTAANI
jgi:5-methylcytosine-specific restriction endonuclease McrA